MLRGSGYRVAMPHLFDAASGLPLSSEARRAMNAALEHGWADPSRLYRSGRLARQLLDAARASVATSIGALPQEVRFTASGTQSVHLGVLGLARGRRKVGAGIVASAVEHSAVLRAADFVAGGHDLVLTPVNHLGEVDVKAFRKAVKGPGVALAAVQQVNHEVGTLQPLAQVHEAAHKAGVPLFVDACAGLGSVPAPDTWDVLAGSAHKWGGPTGVGILAIRTGVRWRSPIPTDESGAQMGFPHVAGAVAAATALEEATRTLGRIAAQRQRLVTILRERVPELAPDVLALGGAPAAPHIVCFTVLYADGEVLVRELDRAGFAVSSGSACTSDTRRPSHVLAAMGAITHGNLRVSLPPAATEAEVGAFLMVLPPAIRAAREAATEAARR